MYSRQNLACFIHATSAIHPLSLILCNVEDFQSWLSDQSASICHWIAASGFSGKDQTYCFLPDESGSPKTVLVGIDKNKGCWQIAHLPLCLPEGHYCLAKEFETQWAELALGWGLGAYQFTAFKTPKRRPAVLVIPETLPQSADVGSMQSQLQAWYLVRDLINMPSESLGPEELATAAYTLAQYYNAEFQEIVGENLLKENYPAIHAVGRASTRAPRLIDLRWGENGATKITIIGKGVCFDSGGFDLKTSSGMALMKKDMGGAAHALGLASLIMDAQLPVQLRVLIPAVENLVSGNAYKPGDVVKTRKGLTVEIGDTDAEGRVILADALAEAASENPQLIIDFATLTGAARVALGPDIPVMFSNDESIAAQLLLTAHAVNEPIWRLPLYQSYREYLDSSIADINNNGSQPYAGAITAALFLQTFVGEIPWVHFDLMAWNLLDKPGHPKGGEAMALQTVFKFLSDYFRTSSN